MISGIFINFNGFSRIWYHNALQPGTCQATSKAACSCAYGGSSDASCAVDDPKVYASCSSLPTCCSGYAGMSVSANLTSAQCLPLSWQSIRFMCPDKAAYSEILVGFAQTTATSGLGLSFKKHYGPFYGPPAHSSPLQPFFTRPSPLYATPHHPTPPHRSPPPPTPKQKQHKS